MIKTGIKPKDTRSRLSQIQDKIARDDRKKAQKITNNNTQYEVTYEN